MRRTWPQWRALVTVLVAVVAAEAGVAGRVPSVAADSPVLQTWWTARNVAVDSPVPTLIPAPVPLPAVTVPSDDIPDGGSDVAGTESQPVGLLTMRYEFPAGSSVGTLVLTVAADVPPTPGTALSACPLTGDGTFRSVPGGGPISRAPAHDCGRRTEGTFDETSGTWRFDVAGFVDGDHLAVAIMPVAGRAVFERARSDSLEVQRPALVPSPPPATIPAAARPAPLAPAAPSRTPAPVASLPAVVVPPRPSPPAVVGSAPLAFGRYDGRPDPIGSAAVGSVVVLLAVGVTWRRGRRALLALPGRGAAVGPDGS